MRLKVALKWFGTVLCGLLLVAIPASCGWTFRWVRGVPPSESRCIFLYAGAFIGGASPAFEGHVDYTGPQDGFSIGKPALAEDWTRCSVPRVDLAGSARYLIVPGWMLLALLGGPTVLLWRLDRRPLACHCRKCGYDLRGAVSDRCSECGTLIAAEPAREAGRHTITERGVSTNNS